MITVIKNLFNFLFFLIIDFFIGFKKNRVVSKTLLLIRLDSIGDYILFRNFIAEIKKSGKYSDYKVSLCGNIIWKDLAEALDRDYINDFIWLDRVKFLKKIGYKISFLRLIRSKGFETVVNTAYTRELLFADQIVKSSGAVIRIGISGSPEKETKVKIFTNRFYTKLIPASKENYFEFFRNKEFIEKLIEEKVKIVKPDIDVSAVKPVLNDAEQYVVVFPGAKEEKRCWEISSFSEVSKYILENFDYKLIIAGSLEDKAFGEEIKKLCKDYKVLNLCGKTTLIELAKLISNAKLLVSNETSAVHFAVAVNTPFVCISNGNHFGRFHPYPTEIFNDGKYIYPEEISSLQNDYGSLYEKYRFSSELNINTVEVTKVIEMVKELLSSKSKQ